MELLQFEVTNAGTLGQPLDTSRPGNKKGLLPARSRTGSSLAGGG